jgi:tetratricopeptide (TPR) repeat protein
LLDALLPEMDGFELCRRIKGASDGSQTAVVLISGAYRGWQMRKEFVGGLGADAYFEKPVDLKLLVDRIESLAQRNEDEGDQRIQRIAEALVQLRAGLLALKEGHKSEAQTRLEDSIRLDPFSARSHFYLGKAYDLDERPLEAMYEYEQATGLDPEFFHPMRDLAILYEQQGFRARALGAWQQALTLCVDSDEHNEIMDHIRALRD